MRPKKMVQSDQGSRAFCNVGLELKSNSVDALPGSPDNAPRVRFGAGSGHRQRIIRHALPFLLTGRSPTAQRGWMEMRGATRAPRRLCNTRSRWNAVFSGQICSNGKPPKKQEGFFVQWSSKA